EPRLALVVGLVEVELHDLVGIAAVDRARVVHQPRDQRLLGFRVLRALLGLLPVAIAVLLLGRRLRAGLAAVAVLAREHDAGDDQRDNAEPDADHHPVVAARLLLSRAGPAAGGDVARLRAAALGGDARMGGAGGRAADAAHAGAAAATAVGLLLRRLRLLSGDGRVALLRHHDLAGAGDFGQLGVGDDLVVLGVVGHGDGDGVGALGAAGLLAAQAGGNLDDVPAAETARRNVVGHSLVDSQPRWSF